MTNQNSDVLTGVDPEKASSTSSLDLSGATEPPRGNTDPNIVFWDGFSDLENPLNWSKRKKYGNTAIVALLTFLAPLASSMFTPGVSQIKAEFGTDSDTLGEFVVSVYILGFAVGPLILAPLSEMYGRVPVYHVTNIGFIVFSAACGVSTNMVMLIVFRFFQGCFGATPISNGGGTIADLFSEKERGGIMAIYSLGPVLGPAIGPVCGAYLVAAKGWRWVFWVLCMVGGLLTSLSVIFLRESCAPVVLRRKVQRLVKETGNEKLRSKLSDGLTPKQRFARSVGRPAKLLVFSPIVLLSSLFMAVVYGYLYLMLTTFTVVFQGQYDISTANVGLTYLGNGVGSIMGVFLVAALSDRVSQRLSKPSAKNPDGVAQPEFRMPILIATSPLIPIGLFMYGWMTQYRVHWIAPIIGTALVGIGNIAVFTCIQTYLVDGFTIYAASALGANTIARSVFGAVLPLAAESMYNKLGLGWGNSLLAFIAIALLPVPVLFMKYGRKMRESFDVTRL